MDNTRAVDGILMQREYIAKLEAEHFGWDILVGDAFVRGMRDIGYKSTSFALAELIDNAIQASASKIDVVFGFNGGAKPTAIAVVDNGYGMEPKMIRASLIWGAGTRAEDRRGFGKYGYGLPSASVSQCHRVSVYSKPAGGSWQSAYMDIDEISQGQWNRGNRIETPEAVPEEPPAFVVDYLTRKKRWNEFDHGTIVVWEDLDRIDVKLRDGLRNNLVTHLGVIYRNYLLSTPMTVDGVDVEPCDPLFLTEGFRHYDLDDDRAIALPPAVVEVKDKASGKALGNMRVRFARMPSTFFRRPESKWNNKATGKEDMNARLEIADANNGIIFLRNGRQIDVLRPPRSLGTINATTDRFWAVEVDFDASLDDFFSITTSKQQVKPEDRIWDMLKDKAKIFDAIGGSRTEYKKEAGAVAAKAEESKTSKRASVEAIEKAAKFRITKPPKESPGRKVEADNNLRQEARKRARRAGIDVNQMELELVAQQEGHPHAVETEDLPGAPFFRCVPRGGQRVLCLNVAHPFYIEVYAAAGSTPRTRAAIEILLWTLGEAEIDADPDTDRRRFYERERASVWSPYLAEALTSLRSIAVVGVEQEDSAA
ncbi:ATP-binding protein [Micromonospora lupini]|uniref:ATP-binding protein n=1 Tax=Micromonospora lupini TaxID=285679 RepID=UPI003407580D